MVKLLDGAATAGPMRAEAAEAVAEMQERHSVTPGLAAVLVGDNPASAVYVRNKQRACQETGIYSEAFRLPEDAKESEVYDLVQRLNEDDRFHGILVQLPLPRQVNERRIVEAINPDKDVDGLTPVNMGRLAAGLARYVPCTPGGIQQLLLRNGYDPGGKGVVICGRSQIVGMPLAILLMQRKEGANATVTVCHTGTQDLAEVTRQADILVAAMGRPTAITADMVKPGAVVVDVGVNRVPDETKPRGYRLAGDVDFDAVSEKVEAISPVPGGVGPMTITMLLLNTLAAARFSVDGAP